MNWIEQQMAPGAMDKQKDCRKAFDKWQADTGKRYGEEYVNDFAWGAWQAAWGKGEMSIDLESLSERSLDHICETVSSTPDYSAGKENMRQWFLDNLRTYALTKQSVDDLIEKILTILDHYAVDGWVQMDTAEDLIAEQIRKHFLDKMPSSYATAQQLIRETWE